MTEPAQVEFLTRRGCHLCEVMEEVVRSVLSRRSLGYTKVDVDTDPELLQRYGDTVPVLRYRGRELARVRIDAADLETLLEQLP